MSEYDTTKNGIADRLKGLGFSESKVPFDWENASRNEYDKAFILICLNGELDEDSSETIVDRVYDFQTWRILIAFGRSSASDIIQRDQMHRKKDEIIKDLDDPSNWTSFARVIKYKNWAVEEMDNYFLLNIDLEVQEEYVY